MRELQRRVRIRLTAPMEGFEAHICKLVLLVIKQNKLQATARNLPLRPCHERANNMTKGPWGAKNVSLDRIKLEKERGLAARFLPLRNISKRRW